MDGKKVIIQSNQLLLRMPAIADCDEFLGNVSDSRAMHEPWIYPPINRTEYINYLKRCDSQRMTGLLVLNIPGNKFIGVINVNEIIRGAFQSAFLGFYGFTPMCGKGYMTEALKLAIKHCFQNLKLHRVEANIQPENERSIRLVTRCGFKKEGFSPSYLKVGGKWRDHERWARLSTSTV